eukprot:9924258-Ditylum_brightwellii.AAC.1
MKMEKMGDIMGWKHISVLLDKISIKECVGNHDQNVSEIESWRTDDVEVKNKVSNKDDEKKNMKSYKDAFINNDT